MKELLFIKFRNIYAKNQRSVEVEIFYYRKADRKCHPINSN